MNASLHPAPPIRSGGGLRLLRRSRRIACAVAAVGLALFAMPASAHAYTIVYRARILAEKAIAEVEIEVRQSQPGLLQVSADLDARHWFNFRGEGVSVEDDGFVWAVPASGGSLRYTTAIDRVRDEVEYDSRCTSEWMLTRAEDLFPPMASRSEAGAEARAVLELDVPPRWQVVTPYPRGEQGFVVEHPGRRFDQPKGWMIAGRIERLDEEIEGMKLVIAAPKTHDVRLRDAVAFLRLTLPSLAAATGVLPERLTIVSADDPMWRGGLSGPESLYVHADRPFIDDDGSSPLLHEIVHVVTSARSVPGYDWIVEGIAEWASLEMLRRSGAVSEAVHEASLERLRKRGRKIERFVGESKGAETARAVGVIASIDAAIRAGSEDASFDDVLAALAVEGHALDLDRDTLIALVQRRTGVDVSALVPETDVPKADPPAAAAPATSPGSPG